MDREDIQGIVLHGYRSLPFARYHLLGFEAGKPRQVLTRLVSDVSSSAEPRAEHRLQLALTAVGLAALGLPPVTLAQFSREFRQGMAHAERSAALGDRAEDAPEAWEFGGPSTPALGALCMTFANSRERLEQLAGQRARLFERFGLSARSYDAEPLATVRAERARSTPKLPRWQRVPLGEIVLGERDAIGERQRGPFVPVKYGTRPLPEWSRRERAFDFGQSGSYLVLRKLSGQSRVAFEPGTEGSLAHRLLLRSRPLTDGSWFMALNASIRRQFEYVQRSAGESRQFRVQGGAYFFLPGIQALNYLAEPGG